jgi:hypothetical protein
MGQARKKRKRNVVMEKREKRFMPMEIKVDKLRGKYW